MHAETEELILTKKGKPRKRKPKQKNVYFTQDTEDAILEYRSAFSQEEKNRIYNERIHHAFYKLVENIIHTFKFYYTEVDNIEDLKYEVISFLLQKLHLYDQSKGKAYSYFGTITKRYLIIYNQKNYKKLVSKTNIEDVGEDFEYSTGLYSESSADDLDVSNVFYKFVKEIDDNLLEMFPKTEEAQVADAIVEIFKKKDKIDIFNKKALFIYIKEITDVQSNTITRVIKKLKTVYKNIVTNHIENVGG